MQRAVTPAEPTEPQMTKPQASPNKVSTSSAKTSPIKENITIQKSGMKDENHQGIQTAGGPRKEDTMPHVEKPLGSISGPTEEKIDGSPPTAEYPSVTTPLTKGTAAVTFDSNKPPLAQLVVVDKDIKRSESPPAKKDIGKKEEAAETVKKSTDKPDEVKPKQTLNGESDLLKSSLAETTPSVTQTPNQELGGFFSSSSPMTQLSTSKTAEAVTGKVLGFGSSLFSSASTLITSAVQESRTPPNSRKMSAPAQISDKVSASKVLPKSSPPVSPKRMLTKETKPPTTQTLLTEKDQDKPLQAKVTMPAQTKTDRGLSEPGRPDVAPGAGKSTCPLCKADLNVGSKDPSNYRTCTECKTHVCSKCGFSPMPSVKEVMKFISPCLHAEAKDSCIVFIFQGNEWLCLNCQMQRALGASEPPGFPMIKSPTLPHKEVPANTQKENSPALTSQEDIPKPDLAKINVLKAGEPEDSSLGAATKKVTPDTVFLSNKPVTPTVSKVEEKILDQTPKGQPILPEQKAPKLDPTAAKSTPDQEIKKQDPSKDVTSMTKPLPPAAPETVKSSPQKQQPAKPITKEHLKTGTSPAKSAPPPAQPPKQDSGGFFGFGGPKSQPAIAQSAGSVTGKMFGFGSSFLSSASTFITSTVQDDPKTTPPTPRKMSTAGHASPKNTPPASPKLLPVKDTKPLKTEEKTPVKPPTTAQTKPLQAPPIAQTKPPQAPPPAQVKPPQAPPTAQAKPPQAPLSAQAKPPQAPPTAQAKAEKAPPEESKASTDKQGSTKANLSICSLCNVQLNMGSKEHPNYSTCTECKTTVCSQCGFNPKPNMVEVNGTIHDRFKWSTNLARLLNGLQIGNITKYMIVLSKYLELIIN